MIDFSIIIRVQDVDSNVVYSFERLAQCVPKLVRIVPYPYVSSLRISESSDNSIASLDSPVCPNQNGNGMRECEWRCPSDFHSISILWIAKPRPLRILRSLDPNLLVPASPHCQWFGCCLQNLEFGREDNFRRFLRENRDFWAEWRHSANSTDEILRISPKNL